MIYRVVIFGLLGLVGMVLTYQAMETHRPPYKPLMKRGDCFIFRTHKVEHPDGYITYRHDDYYTVMWYKEAYKRYGGPKVGYDVPVKWLDEYTYKTKCPW